MLRTVEPTTGAVLFPILGPERRERADAARNRQRILRAAESLYRRRGFEAVTMDEVAAAAGVGKGTIYRRFGDRASLALALLGRAEEDLQSRILFGPPPLGPGAQPAARLVAFLDALLELVDRHIELHVVSETGDPGTRYRSAVYAFYRRHVEMLIEQARPDLDAGFMADALLAPLGSGLIRHQRDRRGMSLARIGDGLRRAARAILSS
jgi:AcrR family transcriptional regulator